MRTIKKHLKFILSFIAFALVSFAFAFSPVMPTYALSELNETVIKVTNAPHGTVEASKGLEIPYLASAHGGYVIRVVDPANNVHEYTYGANSDSYFTKGDKGVTINVLNAGLYTYSYIVKSGENEVYNSKTYSVTVEGSTYSLDFTIRSGKDEGKVQLVPSKVAKGGSSFTLPKAYVRANGEVNASDDAATIQVTKNGGTKVEESTTDNSAVLYKDANGVYHFNPKDEGTYTVVYSSGLTADIETYEIKVLESFTNPTADDMVIGAISIPTLELGKTTELKKPTVNVGEDENTSQYNIVSIKITSTADATVTKTLTNNDLSVSMTKEFFGVDSYNKLNTTFELLYTIEDAYGNTQTKTVTTSTITDSTKPSVYAAYEYQVNEGVVENVKTNASVDIKAKYGYSELLFPAIYAEDLVSNYSEMTLVRYLVKDNSDNSSNIYYLDNIDKNGNAVAEGSEGYNYYWSNHNLTQAANKAVKFEFSSTSEQQNLTEGNYTLYYLVISNPVEGLKQTNNNRYNIEVLNTATSTGTSKATVKINGVADYDSVDISEKLSVSVSASDDDDSRVKKALFYAYSASDITANLEEKVQTVVTNNITNYNNFSSSNVLDSAEFVSALNTSVGATFVQATEEDSKFNVNFASYTSGNVVLVAVALNDYGKVTVDTKTLYVKNTTETNAPTYDVTANGNLASAIAAGANSVALPTVKFSDEDKTLDVKVEYYIGESNVMKPTTDWELDYEKEIVDDVTIYSSKVNGGTIYPSKAGTYYVVYSATDDANNTTSVVFKFSYAQTSYARLEVSLADSTLTTDGSVISSNVGQDVKFNVKLFNASNEDITNTSTIKVKVENGGKSYSREGFNFVFDEVGSYTLTFSNELNDVSQQYVVNVSSLSYAWMDGNTKVDTSAYKAKYKYANKNSTIVLPYLTAVRSDGNKNATVGLKITLNGEELAYTTEILNGQYVYKFNTTDAGTYKVVYSATASDCSLEALTLEIKAGDNVAPTFTLNNVSELEQELTYDGTNKIKYQINLTTSSSNKKLGITVSCNDKEIYSFEDLGLVIKDVDESGEETTISSWSGLKVVLSSDDNIVESGENSGEYYITGTGTCKLTLTYADENGNSEPKVITFNVVDKVTPVEKKDNVAGIVLVVVSLVILAATIAFFAITGAKGGKGKAKKAKAPKAKKEVKVSNKNSEVEEKVEAKADEAKEESEAQPAIEETKTPEVEEEAKSEETNDEPKSGDVE